MKGENKMNYQEKLEEMIREMDNVDELTLEYFMQDNPYEEKNNENSFLWGLEQGIKLCLNIAEKSNINGEL